VGVSDEITRHAVFLGMVRQSGGSCRLIADVEHG
jgi:hypothetical protein